MPVLSVLATGLVGVETHPIIRLKILKGKGRIQLFDKCCMSRYDSGWLQNICKENNNNKQTKLKSVGSPSLVMGMHRIILSSFLNWNASSIFMSSDGCGSHSPSLSFCFWFFVSGQWHMCCDFIHLHYCYSSVIKKRKYFMNFFFRFVLSLTQGGQMLHSQKIGGGHSPNLIFVIKIWHPVIFQSVFCRRAPFSILQVQIHTDPHIH